MSNKPNWDDAPDWAVYLGQDIMGRWKWMESEPYPSRETDSWCSGGRTKDAKITVGSWKDTLEIRPVITREEARKRIHELNKELNNLKKVYSLGNKATKIVIADK